MFLRSFVANEMKYQLDLSVSVQDMPHKLILIRIILKPKKPLSFLAMTHKNTSGLIPQSVTRS